MKKPIIYACALLTPAVAFQPIMPQRRMQIRMPTHVLQPSVCQGTLAARRCQSMMSAQPKLRATESEEEEESESNALLPSSTSLVLPAALALAGLGALAWASPESDLEGIVEQAQSFDLAEFLRNINTIIDGLGPIGFVYFSAAYIALEVLALPAIPLTASAGYIFGTLPGTAVVLFSATIAAGISFLIGRTFLRERIATWADDNKMFRAMDKAVGREGFKVVLLLRLSPLLPFALSNYFFGLTSVEFWPYLAGTALGFSPGTFAYVYSGDAAKALSSATEAGGVGTDLPWLGYVAVFAFIVAFGKVASDVATDALKEMEVE